MSLTRMLRDKASTAVLKKAVKLPEGDFRFDMQLQDWSDNPQRMGHAVDLGVQCGLLRRTGGSVDQLLAPLVFRLTMPGAESDERFDALARFEEAEARVKEWVNRASDSTDIDPDTVRAIITIAEFEMHRRAAGFQELPPEDVAISTSDVQCLTDALAIAPWNELTGTRETIINPTFGEGSRLVGGADGDLLRDATIIEIKTVKTVTLPIATVRQLAAYTVLARHFGVSGRSDDSEIRRMGVYHSRSGQLVEWTIDECLHPGGETLLLDLLNKASESS